MNTSCPVCNSAPVRNCTEIQSSCCIQPCMFVCIQSHHWHLHVSEPVLSNDCNVKYGIETRL